MREAGVRLPGAMGNTIGIVGGLIIGQAAVEANLVSPIVVIVVAFTALCSFAVPNEEFATAFRILKFFFIAMCAWLGFFGFLMALLAVLIHLSHLKSFGIPYMMPFVGADVTDYQDERDSLLRLPLYQLRHRPVLRDATIVCGLGGKVIMFSENQKISERQMARLLILICAESVRCCFPDC